MKKFVLLCLTLFVCMTSSFGQSVTGGDNAKEVWAEFQKNPSNMYIFLDGITASDNPSGYKYYVQEFISTCIKRGVEWDALFDELKETVLPKDSSLATCYAVSLCEYATNYKNIIKTLDLIPKHHTREGYYIKGADIYPDGTIVFPICYGKYGSTMIELAENSSFPEERKNVSDEYERQYFIYRPEGNLLLGRPDIDDSRKLKVGFILNREGEKVGEKYYNYNSFADKAEADRQKELAERKKEQAQENRRTAAATRRQKTIYNSIVRTYGKRAADAMSNFQPYVGMPEGALRDYAFSIQDGDYHVFEFVGVIGAYRVYKPSGMLRLINSGYNYHWRYPSVVYAFNGKVSAVKW